MGKSYLGIIQVLLLCDVLLFMILVAKAHSDNVTPPPTCQRLCLGFALALPWLCLGSALALPLGIKQTSIYSPLGIGKIAVCCSLV